MRKIALVICRDKNKSTQDKEGIFKKVLIMIKDYIKSFKMKEYFEGSVKSVIISENIEISLITLPYTIEDISKISKRRVRQINGFLKLVMEERNLDCIILPENIYSIHEFENCSRNSFNGGCLYKCLLANIIDEIFSFRGIKAWELDIVIVQGQNREDLYRIISLLSPLVRYLTVISQEREIIESEAGEEFLDSGLAVIITEDYKSAFKNSDLIINLDGARQIIQNTKTKSGAVIINYGSIDPSKVHENSILITGIDVNIPGNISNAMRSNIYKFFTPLELAEIIILNSMPFMEMIKFDSFPQLENIIPIVKMFIKDGYGISKFVGRRSTFNLKKANFREEDLKKVK